MPKSSPLLEPSARVVLLQKENKQLLMARSSRGATGGLIMPKLLNVSVHLAPLGRLHRFLLQKCLLEKLSSL